MDQKSLESIGLTQNESKIYLALIELGSSTTGEIIKKSAFKSGRIYEILESLKEKGLISETIVDGTRIFTASSPKELLQFNDKKKKEILENEKKIKELIPVLNEIRNQTLQEPRTMVYTGFKGFQTAVHEATETLKKGDEVLTFGIRSEKSEKINLFWQNWTRNNPKVETRYIFTDKKQHYRKTKSIKKTNIKFLQADTPAPFDIFGDEVVLFMQYQEPMHTIAIYDKATVKTFKEVFKVLWCQAK